MCAISNAELNPQAAVTVVTASETLEYHFSDTPLGCSVDCVCVLSILQSLSFARHLLGNVCCLRTELELILNRAVVWLHMYAANAAKLIICKACVGE